MAERGVIGVCGVFSPEDKGVVDAHNHLWIARPAGVAQDLPDLQSEAAVSAELADFRTQGGYAVLDCQPGGAGRDAGRLASIARASGVAVVACTGFHRSKYYPPDYWLWRASADEACEYFEDELSQAMCAASGIRAGFIKVAAGETLDSLFAHLARAAAKAARKTGAAIGVHTEKGLLAEEIVGLLEAESLPPERVILFHMDKRPQFELHRRLARRGVLLEYDTFLNPKYSPETGVWPLLQQMVSDGLDGQICVGTDMARPTAWARLGGSPGLCALGTQVIPRMRALGFAQPVIARLTGGNILARLAQM